MTLPKAKKVIKVKFQNGLTFKYGVKEILSYVADRYDFMESDEPDFIIFGPYGDDLPPKSEKYTRIGYFCENIVPDLSICEWAFGMPLEAEVGNPRYKKIQWHNLNPDDLVKKHIDIEAIISSKHNFCNFLYSHKVPHREKFFKELSKYKKVDAPGRSMTNMPSIDTLYSGDTWERKRQFLRSYKFTIAFENDSYPGYQTEKLYDAMLEWSIPVYCGDPYIGDLFNEDSFINGFSLLQPHYGGLIRQVERFAQMDFTDYRPAVHHSLPQKIIRKVKSVSRSVKTKIEFKGLNYKRLVDKVVEIDENDDLYREMLLQPWFKNNSVPQYTNATSRWIEIFG